MVARGGIQLQPQATDAAGIILVRKSRTTPKTTPSPFDQARYESGSRYAPTGQSLGRGRFQTSMRLSLLSACKARMVRSHFARPPASFRQSLMAKSALSPE